MGNTTLIVRANWVLPITSDPIQNGEVVIEGDRIAEVRPQVSDRNGTDVLDLGDAILMPGLVNVHSHLEYTCLRHQVESSPFFNWLRQLIELKAQTPPEEWLPSALLGAEECIAGGITTVGDNTDTGVTIEALARSGLRGRVYQEVFGIGTTLTEDELVQELEDKLQAHALTLRRWEAQERVSVEISPHAVYTVPASLLRLLVQRAEQKGWFLSIHASESLDEVAFTRSGTGRFAENLAERGIGWETPHLTPIAYLAKLGALSEKTLLVHCVKAEPNDIRLMANARCAIAHCPRSNAKLLSGVAPVIDFLRAGIRVGLGTDGVVSSQSFDLFEEVRCAAWLQRASRYTAFPDASKWVEIATLGGAQALGLADQIGSLEVGKKADLCAVRTTRTAYRPLPDPATALVYVTTAQDVCLTIVDGRVLYQEGK